MISCSGRSARWDCCRAQNDNRPFACAAGDATGPRAGEQPRQHLLSDAADLGADLATMRRLDELHMDFPFAASRMLRDLLAAEGVFTSCPG